MDSPVPGMLVLRNVITAEEEADVLRQIGAGAWDTTPLTRRTQQYGYAYDYAGGKGPVPTTPCPAWATDLFERCLARSAELGAAVPPIITPAQQIIVNEYTPGQGIGPHTDHVRYFGPYVVAVSVGGGCTMVLSRVTTGEVRDVYLPPRSMYWLTGDARYLWTHAIPARLRDDGVPRRTRYSVTFRTMAHPLKPP